MLAFKTLKTYHCVSLSDCTVDSLRVTNAHQEAGEAAANTTRGMAGEQGNDGPGQRPPHCSPLSTNWTAWATQGFDSTNITRTVVSLQCEWESCCYSEEAAFLALVQFSLLLSSQSREININDWSLKRLHSSLSFESLGDMALFRILFFGVARQTLSAFLYRFSCMVSAEIPTPLNGQTPPVNSLDQLHLFLSFDKLLKLLNVLCQRCG